MATSRHEETRFVLTARDQTRVALDSVKSNLGAVGNRVTGLQGQLLGLAGIGGFGLLVSGLIETNKQFQGLKSSLKTVTGSAKAAGAAFDMIENFAVTTPYELEEVVGSFIKLKALGLDPSEAALRSYGNTASAMGKSLDQMIEAVADASTGEFERLKEFGIRASKQGDQVSLTFQGVTTTIGNSADEITAYLQAIGNSQFGTAMADQMGNLAPAFSNLGAAIRGIQVDIGEAGLNDAIATLTNRTTDWINAFDEQQIRRFTGAALNGLAGVLDGGAAIGDYLDKNPYLLEAGLVGYLLFGKKGLAAIAAGQAITEGLGRGFRADWEWRNPSGVTFAPGADAPNRPETRPHYQLGDFNQYGKHGSGFADWAGGIRQERGGDRAALDEQTSLLRDIADTLRNSASAAATAG